MRMRVQIECEAPENFTRVKAVIAETREGRGLAQLTILSARVLVFPHDHIKSCRFTPQQWEVVGLCITDHGQSCGCDPIADCMCERHQTELNL